MAIPESFAAQTQVNVEFCLLKGNSILKVGNVETMCCIVPVYFMSRPWQNGKPPMKMAHDLFSGALGLSIHCNWTMEI